nr:lantibiotic dehydratase [Pedobacter sp. MR2016-19]
MTHLLDDREYIEALYLASPVLQAELTKLEEASCSKKQKDLLMLSLAKYALRMHNRCTPFGLFAGCGVSNLNELNEIIIDGWGRHTTLDMNFVFSLAQELSKDKGMQNELLFYSNNSIYVFGDYLRYVDYIYKNGKRNYRICSVDNSEYLQKILNNAINGCRINDLVDILVREELDKEDVVSFIDELIENQLLVSELEPTVIGDDALNQMLFILEKLSSIERTQLPDPILKTLKLIQEELSRIDKKIGNEVEVYKALTEKLSEFDVQMIDGKMFQTDLFIKTFKKVDDRKFPFNLEEKLKLAFKVLSKLKVQTPGTKLKDFAIKFQERYEDQEVQLLQVLDNESGIGYFKSTYDSGDDNPLVDELGVSNEVAKSTMRWNQRESFLLKKMINAYKNDDYTVEIAEEDLEGFNDHEINLPVTMAAFFSHLGWNDGKESIYLKTIGGSSGVNLIGRFSGKNDKMLKLAKELSTHESNFFNDAIVAEISHLPQNRVGNVIARPVFREFEIPYLTRASLANDAQINVNDLFLSVRNGELYLRSKKLNKQVIPRLGNAHSYSYNSLPVYHFLCDMQLQNTQQGLYFDWGILMGEFKFLPRVQVNDIILSPARWQLTQSDLKILIDEKNELKQTAKKWASDYNIPTLFLIVESDNELLIDIDNELSVKLLLSIVKKKSKILLEEFLFTNKDFLLKDNSGNNHTNEIIAFFKKDGISPVMKKHEDIFQNPAVQRKMSLGSEWLSYKFFCGVKIADLLLTDIFSPLLDQLINEQLIDKWFFIRYVDSDFHIRLRFHLNDNLYVGKVIFKINEVLKVIENQGIVWKIQNETYNRELERYSSTHISEMESAFWFDSSYVLNVLKKIVNDEERWLVALISVNELLSNMGMQESEKLTFVNIHKQAFSKEFRLQKSSKIYFDQKYRSQKSKIIQVLEQRSGLTSHDIFIHLETRSISILKIFSKIKKDIGQINNGLISSLIHMSINRIFRSKNRLNEMAIYELLSRYYKSKIKRNIAQLQN